MALLQYNMWEHLLELAEQHELTDVVWLATYLPVCLPACLLACL